MIKYDIIFFDADDTLLDFQKAEKTALSEVFKSYGVEDSEEIFNKYIEINNKLWKSFELGEIAKEDILNSRFTLLFQELCLDKDGIKCNNDYLDALGRGDFLLEGSIEVCEYLSKYCDLYIVTNGVSKTQHSRIDNSPLMKYIKGVFVSEDVGYQKPLKEYFDFVFKAIGEMDRTKALIVGDSLSSDILGGINAGIDTCWFNPYKKENTLGIKADYEIKALQELYGIIEEK
ncbi:YjjG family noncanonical pyrimidine nucleotidase [Alloiococcus sp. CFN-8]|uniref:YjjG family noncanonical pyrimidine nucleotidase n=1 Tax=Alloiococcus sp. CFN-8 TaxID=3416081 RepID=UPI003CF4FF1A